MSGDDKLERLSLLSMQEVGKQVYSGARSPSPKSYRRRRGRGTHTNRNAAPCDISLQMAGSGRVPVMERSQRDSRD